MAPRVAILALMTSVLLLATPPANSKSRGFRATLIRREKAINVTRAAQRSHERLSMLAARLDAASGETSTQTPLRADNNGEYDMEISIGTPPQKLSALADTGSDLVWAKCDPCESCTPQGSPSFDPTQSSTFSMMPCSNLLCQDLGSSSTCTAGGTQCDYKYFYGLSRDHYTQGYMANETLTIGSDAVQGIGFGCTTMSNGNYGTGSGLIGLGRGQLSLVSQLGIDAFSYCLVHDPSMASPLLFGAMATLTGEGVQSTSLLDSSTNTYYTVNLNSISVGTTTTPGTGTNGVLFDSGTTLTFLTEPAYTAAKGALLTQTTLPQVANVGGFEACFQATDNDLNSGAVPPMTLHFDGADMELPPENYFFDVGGGVMCWVVQRSTSLSIIGNVMQKNYQIRYDLEQKMLSFQQANCDSV